MDIALIIKLFRQGHLALPILFLAQYVVYDIM